LRNARRYYLNRTGYQPMGLLAALAGALAWILFTAGGGATLQADALAATTGGQAHARQWLGRWGGFTVCFGDDLVAHVNFLMN